MVKNADRKHPGIIAPHGRDTSPLCDSGLCSFNAHRPDLKRYLLAGPKVDSFEVGRERDTGRKINLG